MFFVNKQKISKISEACCGSLNQIHFSKICFDGQTMEFSQTDGRMLLFVLMLDPFDGSRSDVLSSLKYSIEKLANCFPAAKVLVLHLTLCSRYLLDTEFTLSARREQFAIEIPNDIKMMDIVSKHFSFRKSIRAILVFANKTRKNRCMLPLCIFVPDRDLEEYTRILNDLKQALNFKILFQDCLSPSLDEDKAAFTVSLLVHSSAIKVRYSQEVILIDTPSIELVTTVLMLSLRGCRREIAKMFLLFSEKWKPEQFSLMATLRTHIGQINFEKIEGKIKVEGNSCNTTSEIINKYFAEGILGMNDKQHFTCFIDDDEDDEHQNQQEKEKEEEELYQQGRKSAEQRIHEQQHYEWQRWELWNKQQQQQQPQYQPESQAQHQRQHQPETQEQPQAQTRLSILNSKMKRIIAQVNGRPKHCVSCRFFYDAMPQGCPQNDMHVRICFCCGDKWKGTGKICAFKGAKQNQMRAFSNKCQNENYCVSCGHEHSKTGSSLCKRKWSDFCFFWSIMSLRSIESTKGTSIHRNIQNDIWQYIGFPPGWQTYNLKAHEAVLTYLFEKPFNIPYSRSAIIAVELLEPFNAQELSILRQLHQEKK